MESADNLTEPQISLQQLLAEAKVARLDAELLLAHVLATTRSTLIAHGERCIAPDQALRYRTLVARRAAGEPLAYLTGEREFWSLPLRVNEAVLIPRPETELVVERALVLLSEPRARTGQVRIADLGTGSGAIALALASDRPHWRLLASELSAPALQVARDNARRLQLNQIEFIEGDWFAPLVKRRFEAIVSNPPYVAAGDPALDRLRHEPAAALSPGHSGMEALLHLIAGARAHLSAGGWLVLEHGADQAPRVAAALVATGYARVRCHRDLAGHDRVTEAQWS
jgi:release factor glutamine methyltransferase